MCASFCLFANTMNILAILLEISSGNSRTISVIFDPILDFSLVSVWAVYFINLAPFFDCFQRRLIYFYIQDSVPLSLKNSSNINFGGPELKIKVESLDTIVDTLNRVTQSFQSIFFPLKKNCYHVLKQISNSSLF